MSDHHYATLEQSQRNKALFAIIQALIKNGNGLALKDFFDPYEINSGASECWIGVSLRPTRISLADCSDTL